MYSKVALQDGRSTIHVDVNQAARHHGACQSKLPKKIQVFFKFLLAAQRAAAKVMRIQARKVSAASLAPNVLVLVTDEKASLRKT